MNHKRKRPKHQRAGCLFCKPHKDERGKGQGNRERPQETRAKLRQKDEG